MMGFRWNISSVLAKFHRMFHRVLRTVLLVNNAKRDNRTWSFLHKYSTFSLSYQIILKPALYLWLINIQENFMDYIGFYLIFLKRKWNILCSWCYWINLSIVYHNKTNSINKISMPRNKTLWLNCVKHRYWFICVQS